MVELRNKIKISRIIHNAEVHELIAKEIHKCPIMILDSSL